MSHGWSLAAGCQSLLTTVCRGGIVNSSATNGHVHPVVIQSQR